ncbi:MAG: cyclase family protein [candidate division NC10 bacterium]|nr:cyclase family protein [candidate division NC10 bacterium]
MRVLPLSLLLLPLQAEQVAAGALERAMLGKSTVVDLTHVVSERAPAGGGQDHPRPEVLAEGERNSALQRPPLPSDLATHLDLPASVVKGKPTVAEVPASEFLVHAVVVDIGAKVEQTPDYRATVEDLQAWERRNGRIPKGSAVLLHTGWARRWSDATRYLNLDAQGVPRVPGFSPGAMAFLISQRDIRGVGMDTWGAEVPPGTHGGDDGMRPLLQAGKWQLVNLTNLDRLPAKGAKLVVAPLRLTAGSAPARVIAILP